MNAYLGIIAAIILVIAYFYLRRKRISSNIRPDQADKSATQVESSFHAVSLTYSASACQAARDMQGRRFLSGAAPKIPLQGCDSVECRCKFVHHDDRRTQLDRREVAAYQDSGKPLDDFAEDQRSESERRTIPPRD